MTFLLILLFILSLPLLILNLILLQGNLSTYYRVYFILNGYLGNEDDIKGGSDEEFMAKVLVIRVCYSLLINIFGLLTALWPLSLLNILIWIVPKRFKSVKFFRGEIILSSIVILSNIIYYSHFWK